MPSTFLLADLGLMPYEGRYFQRRVALERKLLWSTFSRSVPGSPVPSAPRVEFQMAGWLWGRRRMPLNARGLPPMQPLTESAPSPSQASAAASAPPGLGSPLQRPPRRLLTLALAVSSFAFPPFDLFPSRQSLGLFAIFIWHWLAACADTLQDPVPCPARLRERDLVESKRRSVGRRGLTAAGG